MARKKRESFEWTTAVIVAELGKDARTVGKMLKSAGLDGDGPWNSVQIFRAMTGDLTAERIRETRERADKLALENAEKRRETVPVQEFGQWLLQACDRLKATIRGAANLEDEDKDKLILALRTAVSGVEGIMRAGRGRADAATKAQSQ